MGERQLAEGIVLPRSARGYLRQSLVNGSVEKISEQLVDWQWGGGIGALYWARSAVHEVDTFCKPYQTVKSLGHGLKFLVICDHVHHGHDVTHY